MNVEVTLTEELAQPVKTGGPEVVELGFVSRMFSRAGKSSPAAARVRAVLASTMTVQCIPRHAFVKPHGYSGDFEKIVRNYTHRPSPDPTLTAWDGSLHAPPAPSAAHNRKDFFKTLFDSLRPHKAGYRVLKVGSGSGADMLEFSRSIATTEVTGDCINGDQSALAFAQRLCGVYADRVSFERKDALPHKPTQHNRLPSAVFAGIPEIGTTCCAATWSVGRPFFTDGLLRGVCVLPTVGVPVRSAPGGAPVVIDWTSIHLELSANPAQRSVNLCDCRQFSRARTKGYER